jgi:SRSO17 transposase
MSASSRFDRFMSHLAQGLEHADRHAGLKSYCTGLMLPLSRKSVEPMAARVDPMHASARHQALHHFVANAQWSDEELLRRVCQWVVPQMWSLRTALRGPKVPRLVGSPLERGVRQHFAPAGL